MRGVDGAPRPAHPAASVKAIGRRAGVTGIAHWNVSQILRASKGQTVPNGEGWSITQRGRSRVMELAQGAGIAFGAGTTIPAPSTKSSTTRAQPGRAANRSITAMANVQISKNASAKIAARTTRTRRVRAT